MLLLFPNGLDVLLLVPKGLELLLAFPNGFELLLFPNGVDDPKAPLCCLLNGLEFDWPNAKRITIYESKMVMNQKSRESKMQCFGFLKC